MPDPNLVVSTNVKSARLEFLGDEEIRKLSCCRVVSPAAFAAPDLSTGSKKQWAADATGAAAAAAAAAAGLAAAVPGGLHDSRMGVFDGRETCGTCGASGSCPGHIGHIELELPALQPILMPSLVKLLKGATDASSAEGLGGEEVSVVAAAAAEGAAANGLRCDSQQQQQQRWGCRGI